jgi:hypothetical protein
MVGAMNTAPMIAGAIAPTVHIAAMQIRRGRAVHLGGERRGPYVDRAQGLVVQRKRAGAFRVQLHLKCSAVQCSAVTAVRP